MIFTELLLWGFRVIVETKNNPILLVEQVIFEL